MSSNERGSSEKVLCMHFTEHLVSIPTNISPIAEYMLVNIIATNAFNLTTFDHHAVNLLLL